MSSLFNDPDTISFILTALIQPLTHSSQMLLEKKLSRATIAAPYYGYCSAADIIVRGEHVNIVES